jgi:hypothetical protein
MLEKARPLVRQSGRVTVARLQALLEGGTLGEVSAVLRAAKMEVGAVPWTPESLPSALQALLQREAQDGLSGADAALTLRAEGALAAVAPVLASTRDALERTLGEFRAAALAQVAEAEADAERRALEAWQQMQEVTEAVQAIELAKADTEAQLLEVRHTAASERQQLVAELADLRHAHAAEAERASAARAALDEARAEHTRLLHEMAALSEQRVTASTRAQQEAQRAAVAETRLEQLVPVETRLAEMSVTAAGLRDVATRREAEAASLREALAVVQRETTYLREALERAHAAATDAAKTVGAQERELQLLRGQEDAE